MMLFIVCFFALVVCLASPCVYALGARWRRCPKLGPSITLQSRIPPRREKNTPGGSNSGLFPPLGSIFCLFGVVWVFCREGWTSLPSSRARRDALENGFVGGMGHVEPRRRYWNRRKMMVKRVFLTTGASLKSCFRSSFSSTVFFFCGGVYSEMLPFRSGYSR